MKTCYWISFSQLREARKIFTRLNEYSISLLILTNQRWKNVTEFHATARSTKFFHYFERIFNFFDNSDDAEMKKYCWISFNCAKRKKFSLFWTNINASLSILSNHWWKVVTDWISSNCAKLENFSYSWTNEHFFFINFWTTVYNFFILPEIMLLNVAYVCGVRFIQFSLDLWAKFAPIFLQQMNQTIIRLHEARILLTFLKKCS